jgi:hypothetical protein
MWFVTERAVVRLGNLKCHRAICYVGPSYRAVEPTKYLCHLCDILEQAAKLLTQDHGSRIEAVGVTSARCKCARPKLAA